MGLQSKPRRHEVRCVSPVGLHRMAYQEWGDPENPRVVICVHGLTRISDDFGALAVALAPQCRVVCPDVVGRGRSSWLQDPRLYGVPQYTSDMVTLIARLGVDRVQWVGTSMGGLIGMALAAMPDSPVSTLVMNDVGAQLSGKALARIAGYVGLQTQFATIEEAHTKLRQIFSGFGPHSEDQWQQIINSVLVPLSDQPGFRVHYDPAIAEPFRIAYGAAGAQTATQTQDASGQAGQAGQTFEQTAPPDMNLWPLYDAIRIPTLVLRGKQSDLFSAQVLNEMASRGPRAQTVEFEGVGHAPSLMHADQIRVVKSFLDQHA